MPNGFLIIDKPAGLTASEFALKERRIVADSVYPNGRLLLFAARPFHWAVLRGKGVRCYA